MKKNIFTVFCLFTTFVFVVSIYALIFQVIGNDSPNKATIFSGVLSMIGGIVGALGAYFVASNQMNKQFEHEKKKEEKQRKETIEQTLKKLEYLNSEVIEFIRYFGVEFAKPYNEERIAKLEFSKVDLLWIVNSVNAINHEVLKEGYSIDYLNFSRELNNMYGDIIGVDFIPEAFRKENIALLRNAVLARNKVFESFDSYVKEHIRKIQKQIENLN